MKLLTYIILSIFVPAFLQVAAETKIEKEPACCATLEPAIPLSENSLYQVSSIWTNDAAQPISLAAFQGRPQVVTMFFSSCAFVCPILINDMKQIEAALPANVRTNVGFVLISFDTDRDTPATLAAYRARHGLSTHWNLLRGGPDDVLEIAALLGIKFKKDSRGDFAHSNVISLLDSKGEILLQQIGLNRDPEPVSSAIRNLLKAGTAREKVAPTLR